MSSLAQALRNYRPDAPTRNTVGKGTYKIYGVVRNFETGEPVVGAKIEFWQAFIGPTGLCMYSKFPYWNYRGVTYTDGAGRYVINTDCSCKQDKHIHLRVTAERYEPLVLRHVPANPCPPSHRLDISLVPLPYFLTDSGGGAGGSSGLRPGRGYVPPTRDPMPGDTSPDESQYRQDWLDYVSSLEPATETPEVETKTGATTTVPGGGSPASGFSTSSTATASTTSYSRSGTATVATEGTAAFSPSSSPFSAGMRVTSPGVAQQMAQLRSGSAFKTGGKPFGSLLENIKQEAKNTPSWAWGLFGLSVFYYAAKRQRFKS
jgi:hypothetical protein